MIAGGVQPLTLGSLVCGTRFVIFIILAMERQLSALRIPKRKPSTDLVDLSRISASVAPQRVLYPPTAAYRLASKGGFGGDRPSVRPESCQKAATKRDQGLPRQELLSSSSTERSEVTFSSKKNQNMAQWRFPKWIPSKLAEFYTILEQPGLPRSSSTV